MKKKIVAIIFVISLRQTISQYDNSYNAMPQGYQYNPYQNIPYQSYPNQGYENSNWNDEENDNYKDYNESDENNCDCTKCGDLKPNCLNSCPNCISTPRPMFPQNYVILPFPYPYPVAPKSTVTPERETSTTPTTASTTTTTTTTEATTTTETTISESFTEGTSESDMTMSPFHIKPKRPYLITSLRKTKPNWMSKYGIVPISDTFAEKLMLQLRSMKVLHPHKDDARDDEQISSLK